ncbi:Uncharacterised protein [uncultured archaeon]|nr:Uncharacterised protein [uncultured archaeon]
MAPIPPLKPGGRSGGMRRGVRGGKRVVFVTPYAKAAEEEAKKQRDRGFKTEVKKERDDTGTYVYTVFIFEGGF